MVSLIPNETIERLRGQFGAEINTLSPAELQALATADIEGSVSNVRLRELLTDHPVEITRMLQRLCERGLLVSDNRRRWTTYNLVGSPRARSLFDAGDSSHLTGDSSHLTENNQTLQVIAAGVAGRGKAPVPEVRAVILLLCSTRFLTADALASLLNRTAPNLRSRYLTPMVEEGLLRLRYPETPNRPDQAYTTTGENA